MLRTFDIHDEVDLEIEIDLDLEVGIGVRDLACHMDSLRSHGEHRDEDAHHDCGSAINKRH